MSVSAFMFSFAIMVFALKSNSAYAHDPQQQLKATNSLQETIYVVAVGDKIYEVKKDGDDYKINRIGKAAN